MPPHPSDVHPRVWETNVALLGVQLAQLLTVLLAAACVLLCLLALVAHFRHQAPQRQVLQPVYARIGVRRAVGRSLPDDSAPLPSRDPPRVPSELSGTPLDFDRDFNPR